MISYSGKYDDCFIFRSLYQTEMPFQPNWNPRLPVRLKSFLNDSKFWVGTNLARIRAKAT